MAGTDDEPSAFDRLLGLEVVSVGDGEAHGRAAVRDGLRQPFGLVHGGALVSVAESLACRGTRAAVGGRGMTARGVSSQASFLRPVTAGTLHASARARHRGRRTWVWEVDLSDDAGRLCSIVRMTV